MLRRTWRCHPTARPQSRVERIPSCQYSPKGVSPGDEINFRLLHALPRQVNSIRLYLTQNNQDIRQTTPASFNISSD